MQARELFSKQEELSSENEGLRARARLDEEKIKFLQSEVTWLHEQIRSLKRAQFGRKSECWVSPEQGCSTTKWNLKFQRNIRRG
ncbi:MAG: hypothetical protein IPK68_19405 [Bdellovibrionales bacterium]|nr:hypothetical protein [Bdellovibrionales bacterium]